MLAKNLVFLAQFDAAGSVVGAGVLIILTSRADSARTRLASTAAGRFTPTTCCSRNRRWRYDHWSLIEREMRRGVGAMTSDVETERKPRGMLVLRTSPMPKDTNSNGDIFGGWIMSQMDLAAGLMAAEVSRGRAVTVTVDKLVFRLPVKVGQAICIYADLQRVGHTSMDISVEVWARELRGEWEAGRHLVTEAVSRFVAIDDNGKPRPVPDNPEFFSRSSSAEA